MSDTLWIVKVASGKQSGEEWKLALGQEAVLGCAEDADIRLVGDGVAMRHLKFSFDGKNLLIEDLGSQSGFTVDGNKSRHAALTRAARLMIGRTLVRALRVNAEAEAPRVDADAPRVDANEAPEGESNGKSKSSMAPATAEQIQRERDKEAPASREPPPLELQHVWFELRRAHYWRALAILGSTAEGAGPLRIAHAFAEMASLNPDARVIVINATPGAADANRSKEDLLRSIPLYPYSSYDYLDATSAGVHEDQRAIPRLLRYISEGAGKHDTVLLALGSLLEQPRSIPLARVADAALVAVEQGVTRLPDIKRIIEIVDRQRVVGSVILKPEPG